MYETRIRIDDALAEEVKDTAREEERSINNFIGKVLREYVEAKKLDKLLEEQERSRKDEYNILDAFFEGENREEITKAVIDTVASFYKQ